MKMLWQLKQKLWLSDECELELDILDMKKNIIFVL